MGYSHSQIFNKAALLLRNLITGKEPIFKTGIEIVDINVAYIRKTFNIVGARSGAGKTRFCYQLLTNALESGYKILYLSVEDSADIWGLKFFEFISKYRLKDVIIRKLVSTRAIKDEFVRIQNEDIKSTAILEYEFVSHLSIEEIKEMIENKYQHIDMIIVDYCQGLGVTANKSVYDRHTYIANTLREIAILQNKCIIGMCQLNREAAGKNEPDISQLLGSGFYEQSAHSILLLVKKRNEVTGEIITRIMIGKDRIIGSWDKFDLDSNYKENEHDKAIRETREEHEDYKYKSRWSKNDSAI